MIELIAAAVGIVAFLYASKAYAQNGDEMKSTQQLDTSGMTRGERNNNPGNIRFDTRWTWQGQVGKDAGDYLIFDTAQNGVRAMTRDLLAKITRGENTITKILYIYAPPSDNNPTPAYIASVSEWSGIGKDIVIAPDDKSRMNALVTAMIRFENGRVLWQASVITAGVLEGMK
jgi:hypothetical protein